VRLFALFCYRFDVGLVPDLLRNLSFCDAFVSHDDRTSTDRWYDEGLTRRRLIERARDAGADWVLCMDPDERIERSAGDQIRALIEDSRPVVYGFRFRELFAPRAYRIDGVWGTKTKEVLFPLLPAQEFMSLPVHSQWGPTNPEYERIDTGLNIYHLKMIDQRNRTARKDLYNALDPDRAIQRIGYDYLDDERGMMMEDIPIDRLYVPDYDPAYEIRQVGCDG
jgi:GT2 family glycosyltransferase